MYMDYLQTPIGTLEIRASKEGVTHVTFFLDGNSTAKPNDIITLCKQQLYEYFMGERKQFDLPLDPKGTTFQKSIWACLIQIPFGQTASYSHIAGMVKNPKAVRAVGAANGRNPISIIVPCHRIIGSNGTLTGYAGGLERKYWLLKHEGVELPKTSTINNVHQADLFDN